MRVYVAGPMSGYPEDNAPVFLKAAEFLRSLGHDVVTPVELNNEIFRAEFGRDYVPSVDKIGYGDVMLCDFYARDMQEVCTRDGVAVLPGWQQSAGARGEVYVAELLRKVILDATTGERIATKIMQHMRSFGAYQHGRDAAGNFVGTAESR